MRRQPLHITFVIILFASLVLAFLPLKLHAQPIKRHILSLYNPKINQDPYFSLVHQNATMPLNHLGMIVDHRPVTENLLDDAAMQKYHGIITWFRDRQVLEDDKIDTYCDWLSRQIDAGIKVVILEEFGFRKKHVADFSPACARTFLKLGGELTPNFANNSYFFEIAKINANMVEYERKLIFTEPLVYNQIRAIDKNAKIHLTVKRTDMTDSEADLVFTTPQGGYAHSSYVLYEIRDLKKKQWRLNPFDFFREAFGLDGLAVPDTTTLNGKRLFYSHIDGDGIFNLSDIDRKSFSGEIIYDNILKKYSTLPITASLITGYFDLPEFHGERAKKLYHKIFELPNIEVSSHGYAHPLNWEKGTVALRIPNYKFKAETEIKTSIEQMRKLLNELGIKKPVSLFQWTGNCLPSRDDIAIAYENKLLNINGGDTRFDNEYDSVSFVAPLGLLKDGLLLIYSSNSNENTYTNMWQGPYYGYRDVLLTFQNTESPRRLKPINIYYHFYSGETQASLTVVKKAYDWAGQQDIIPIKTSRYAQIVGDFFNMKTATIPNGFLVESGDFLKTVRVDNESRFVDLNKSRGVLGFIHHQQSLYVALTKDHHHEIILTKQAPQTPYIVSANVDFMDVKIDGARVLLTFDALITPNIKLGGLKPQTPYHITGQDRDFLLSSDASGELIVSLAGLENTPTISIAVESSVN